MTEKPKKLLYRIKTVMEMLECSRSTVYNLVDSGKLVKVDAKITADSVQNYYASLIPKDEN
jgi:Helix-turn-helix domain